MIKHTILAAASAVAITGLAATPALSQTADWSGWYAGAQIGYGTGNADWVDNSIYTAGGIGTPILSADPDGVLGGIHLGFNQQYGNIVFGVEGSFDFSGMNSSDPSAAVPTQNTDINWLATIGPRLGYAMDNYLIYLEGGYAAADVETLAINGGGSVYPTQEVHHGGFVGLGAALQVSEAVSIGAEYNYVFLGDKVHAGIASGFGPLSIQVNNVDFHTVTARVSVKLDKLFGN